MATATFRCVLTRDSVFSAAFPYEVVENGFAYRVTCSLHEGLQALASDPADSASEAEVPMSAIDAVRWASLRQLTLDRPAFIKRWQRYTTELQRHWSARGADARAEQLALEGQLFAKKLLRQFDELDFFCTADGDPSSCLAVLHYCDADGLTPCLYVLVDGVTDDSPGTDSEASRNHGDGGVAEADGGSVAR